jgi:hypothetical protein
MLTEAVEKATGWSVGALYFNGRDLGDENTIQHQLSVVLAFEDQMPIVCAPGEPYGAARWADVALPPQLSGSCIIT